MNSVWVCCTERLLPLAVEMLGCCQSNTVFCCPGGERERLRKEGRKEGRKEEGGLLRRFGHLAGFEEDKKNRRGRKLDARKVSTSKELNRRVGGGEEELFSTGKGGILRGAAGMLPVILTVYLNETQQMLTEVPVTPATRVTDVVEYCKEAGEAECHLAEVWNGHERALPQELLLMDLLQQWGARSPEVRFYLRHCPPWPQGGQQPEQSWTTEAAESGSDKRDTFVRWEKILPETGHKWALVFVSIRVMTAIRIILD
ncbi:hypothetical protein CRENBAI_005089 [Crenichthys baileyi]|uniref:Apoptosis-stimulating of p53 protein 2-like RA domain-containing protein n=1 Tax=Crenichthys baileyi TaxID=28760 RepID=A0AAV9SFU6_9TELE